MCASVGYKNTFRLLLQDNNNQHIDAIYDGESLLFTAVYAKQEAVVDFLLEQKANPDLANISGVIPLFMAAQNGCKEMVHLLLKYKASPNIPFATTEASLLDFSQNKEEVIVKKLKPISQKTNV